MTGMMTEYCPRCYRRLMSPDFEHMKRHPVCMLCTIEIRRRREEAEERQREFEREEKRRLAVFAGGYW